MFKIKDIINMHFFHITDNYLQNLRKNIFKKDKLFKKSFISCFGNFFFNF